MKSYYSNWQPLDNDHNLKRAPCVIMFGTVWDSYDCFGRHQSQDPTETGIARIEDRGWNRDNNLNNCSINGQQLDT